MMIANNTLHSPVAERRVHTRRQLAAIEGIVVGVSAVTLIVGGGWLAIVGPMLIATWHTWGSSYHQGQHRRAADSPRHTSDRAGLLPHR